MKFPIILTTLIVIYATNSPTFCSHQTTKAKVYSRAVRSVIKKFYSKNSLQFDIVTIGNDTWKFSADVIENIFIKQSCIEPTRITFTIGQNLTDSFIKLNKSSIIFVKSLDFFAKGAEKLRTKFFDYERFRHFIVIQNNPVNYYELRRFLDKKTQNVTTSHLLNFVSVIVADIHHNKDLVLFQIGHRTSNSACFPLMESINIFSFKKMRWIKNEYEYGGLLDFRKCKLKIKCLRCVKAESYNPDKLREILKIVGQKMKFDFRITNLRSVDDEFFDFELAQLFVQSDFYNVFTFYDREMAFMFSNGERYNAYEKLMIPFDSEVWVLLVYSFMVGFFVIIIVRGACNNSIQDFVFGSSVKTPAFNMIIAFFGQGQNILPKRNFSRYLLMLFTLFCLIIRTGYQGVQFELIYKVNL